MKKRMVIRNGNDTRDWGWKGLKGQVTLTEYMRQRKDHVEAGCFGCCCKNCLYWWSNWNKPGEQAHWCRGGTFYPTYTCKHFVKYKGQQVKTCLKYNVSVFQDGYIECGLVDTLGCEKCYEEFEKKGEGNGR